MTERRRGGADPRRRGAEPSGVRPGTGARASTSTSRPASVAGGGVATAGRHPEPSPSVPEPPPARPLAVAAFAAAGYAAAVGLAVVGAVVLLSWALTPHAGSSLESALRTAAIAWCAVNHVPVVVGTGTIGVLPWLFLALPLALLYRAGSWAARATRVTGATDAALLSVAVAAIYGVVAAVVAAWAATPVAAAVPAQAGVIAAAVGLAGAGPGVVRSAGLVPRLRHAVPASAIPSVRGGLAGSAALVGGAAVVAAVSAALGVGDAASVARALEPGAAGLVVLGLLGAAYAPVAVSWALAYVVGVGFPVGAGTAVTPFEVRLGDLPAMPWLTALPDAPNRFAPLLLAVPVAAGVVGGIVLLRGLTDRAAPVVVGNLLAVAAIAALCCGALAALSTGGMGPGRLAVAGPSPLAVAGAGGVLVLLGAGISVTGETAWRHVKRRFGTA